MRQLKLAVSLDTRLAFLSWAVFLEWVEGHDLGVNIIGEEIFNNEMRKWAAVQCSTRELCFDTISH